MFLACEGGVWLSTAHPHAASHAKWLFCLKITVFSLYTSCLKKSGNPLEGFGEGFSESWTTFCPSSCTEFFLQGCSRMHCKPAVIKSFFFFFSKSKISLFVIFISASYIIWFIVVPLFLQQMGTVGHCNLSSTLFVWSFHYRPYVFPLAVTWPTL